MDLNVERELETIQHGLDHEGNATFEQARHLDVQIAEHVTAIARLREPLPTLEDLATGEIAGGLPATHSAALRKAKSEIRDREDDLALLRCGRHKLERLLAEEQARRVVRLEAQLTPLFVETITEIDGILRRAEVLNKLLAKLHHFSQMKLGSTHGLSQGYGFPSLFYWHERVKPFVCAGRVTEGEAKGV